MKTAPCHPHKPLYLKSKCRPCYEKEYRQRNWERVRAWEKKYTSKKLKTDPQFVSRRRRKYDRTHPELVKERNRRWRLENPEKYKAQRQRWRERNRERLRFQYKTRNRRFHNVANDLTLEQWDMLLRHYKYRCAYCRKEGPLTKDHVIPIARGGDHNWSNVVPACLSCNCSKQDRIWKPTVKLKRAE